MRAVLANLKLFYQRRWLWLAYAYLGLLVFLALTSSTDADEEHIGGPWLLVAFSGVLIGATARDVFNKPFACCLPGHPQAVRKVVFLLGLAVGMVGGVLLMRQCGIGIGESPVIFCAAVCLNMTLYLVVAGFILTPWVPKHFLGGILFGGVVATIMIACRFIPAKLQPIVARYPLWIIVGGIWIGSAIWRQMGQRGWSRRLHGLALRFAASGKEREGYAPLERQYTKEARALAATACFFLSRMSTCPDYGVSRYIWGTLYARLGSLAAWWKWLAVPSIAVVTVSVYTELGAVYVFVWVSWLVVPHSWPPLHSPVLVPAGRRERFLATITLAVVIAGIVGSLTLVISAVSVPLSMLIPAHEIWDISLVCRPVPPVIVSVPFIVVPLVAILYVLVPKRLHIVVVMAIILGMQPAIAAIAVIMIWISMPFYRLRFIGGPALWISMAALFAWMLFGAVCWYKTRRGFLARY